ncbi:hypothetical protein PG999_000976 [Apiospora kogelbergensis]|uniref:Uncharacterized protein n=1 Tax=Apiospora kogelbergensis TaxID=1337665 RepID=A0AAW0RDD9_9PEZI
MDNGYCLYIERLSTTRVINEDDSYTMDPGDREAYCIPTSQQKTADFFIESPWAQGEQFKNNTWTTWLGGPDFGHTTRPDPSNNLYYARQMRVQESLIRRGLIARPQAGDMAREIRKFNISLNPTESMSRTKAWKVEDHRQEPTPEELVSLRLAHFPNVPGLVTKAPMVFSGNDLAIPTNSEPCLFEQVLGIPELREKILEPHIGCWQSLGNLARTSQTIFKLIENTFSHWDLTNQWFGGCDLTMEVYNARKYLGVWTKKQKARAKLITMAMYNDRGVRETKERHRELLGSTKFISVHPVRERQVFGPKTLSGERIPKTEWYDHSDSHADPMALDPIIKGESYISLLRGIYRHGENMQYLHLHQVPFLTVRAVKAIVPSMPNLRALGIYSCDLLNLAHTKDLLNIVIDANRVNTARPPIDFDYYPRFYRGPVENRTGSYGVLWNDMGAIETNRAVAASLLSIMRLAMQGNIDLSSRDKSFNKWLNDFPWAFWTLPTILVSIARILGFEGQYEQMLQESYKERYGNSWKAHLSDMERDTITLQRTLHIDLFVSAMGRPQPQTNIDVMEFFKCVVCGEKLLAGFFQVEQARRAAHARTCHGCELMEVLKQPNHDFRELKRAIAAVPWVRKGDITIEDLELLFRGEEEGRSDAMVWKRKLIEGCQYLRDEEPGMVEAKLEKSTRLRDVVCEDLQRTTDGWERHTLRKTNDKLDEDITKYQNVLGMQISPSNMIGKANNWDEMRRRYCVALAMETGRLANQGPHPGYGHQSFL